MLHYYYIPTSKQLSSLFCESGSCKVLLFLLRITSAPYAQYNPYQWRSNYTNHEPVKISISKGNKKRRTNCPAFSKH